MTPTTRPQSLGFPRIQYTPLELRYVRYQLLPYAYVQYQALRYISIQSQSLQLSYIQSQPVDFAAMLPPPPAPADGGYRSFLVHWLGGV